MTATRCAAGARLPACLPALLSWPLPWLLAGSPDSVSVKLLTPNSLALPLAPAVARAVLCNVLVCTAVLGATAARSLTGKAVGILFPLSAFASLGLEHCIANQYIFALAALTGAPFSWVGALANLAVVTAGNVVGGAGVLAGLLAVGHGSLGRKWSGGVAA